MILEPNEITSVPSQKTQLGLFIKLNEQFLILIFLNILKFADFYTSNLIIITVTILL